MGHESVSVIISTFGSRDVWIPLANRAHLSALIQRPKPEIIRSHLDSLHEARNQGAQRAKGVWLIFLDADDGLEPGYIQAMLAAHGDLRYPRVRYVTQEQVNSNSVPDPVILPKKHLLTAGNYMVIGTMLRRDRFWQAGGFRDLPAYEDWDLWIRCWLQGAETELVPRAVYRAYQRNHSRNYVRNAPLLFNKIAQEYYREAFEKGLLRPCARK